MEPSARPSARFDEWVETGGGIPVRGGADE